MSAARFDSKHVGRTASRGGFVNGANGPRFADSADQQARAASVARTVEGVQSVVNDTSIKK